MNTTGCLRPEIRLILFFFGCLSSASANAQNVVTNSIGMKLIEMPAGSFVMGSPRAEAERAAEELQHKVNITVPFHIGMYEVSQREFHKLMSRGRNSKAYFDPDRGGSLDHPIENITWPVATDFCGQLAALPAEQQAGRTYRLPTEAEWEYACRAGTSTAFHFGDSLSDEQANFNGRFPCGKTTPGTYRRKTTKVGSFEPNAFGLYDMHGNVAEWCADWYDENYYQDSPEDDPLGPPEGTFPDGFGKFYMMVRGGGWLDDARACRSAYRFRAMTTNRYKMIGIRVVCEIEADAK